MPVINLSKYGTFFLDTLCYESASAERILSQLYPEGAKCPNCGAHITSHRATATFWRGARTFCASCDRKFVPSAGTIFEGSHMTYVQFEKILIGLSFGLSHKAIAAMAGVHEDTVGVWESKVKFWESHV